MKERKKKLIFLIFLLLQLTLIFAFGLRVFIFFIMVHRHHEFCKNTKMFFYPSFLLFFLFFCKLTHFIRQHVLGK